jgi:hypothetical protein
MRGSGLGGREGKRYRRVSAHAHAACLRQPQTETIITVFSINGRTAPKASPEFKVCRNQIAGRARGLTHLPQLRMLIVQIRRTEPLIMP